MAPLLLARCLAGKGAHRLDYTEMFVTSHCSIRCKWCSASIPYYPSAYHIPVEKLLGQLDRYLGVVDGVEVFRLLGGEALLHPDLHLVVDALVKSPKVGCVKIVTNGTVVPKNPELLGLLPNPKVIVDVSYYGKVSNKLDRLRELAARGELNLEVSDQGHWFVPNHVYTDKGLTEQEALERYRSCPDWCHVLRDGKIFFCGEAFHIANIDDSPMVAGVDYVDLFDDSLTVRQKHDLVCNLVCRRAPRMAACTRCPGSFVCKTRDELVPGEQLAPGEARPFELPADIENVSRRGI